MRHRARPSTLLAGTLLAVALVAGAFHALDLGNEVAAAPVPPCYFIGNGETAVVGWDSGATAGLLIVQRGACQARAGAPPLNPFALGTANDTYLYYSVAQCCWQIVQSGEGPIRGADLQGGGTRHLSLRTDTSAAANQDFYRYTGAGGPIVMEWEPDQSYTIRRTGMLMARHGPLSVHSSGTSLSAAARVQGNVAGALVSGPYWVPPWMGTSHDTRFELLRREP